MKLRVTVRTLMLHISRLGNVHRGHGSVGHGLIGGVVTDTRSQSVWPSVTVVSTFQTGWTRRRMKVHSDDQTQRLGHSLAMC
jgi:hypothetical protein